MTKREDGEERKIAVERSTSQNKSRSGWGRYVDIDEEG